MDRKKTGVDVILDVLEIAKAYYDTSPFVDSLHQQYLERGFLTKKQLEGLHSKAKKIHPPNIAKLATLEAIIKKLPNRFKSPTPVVNTPVYEKDFPVQLIISVVLKQFPTHRQVLLMKAKQEINAPLTTTEVRDLKKFYELAQLKAKAAEDNLSV